MRILVYDLETSPNLGYVWSLWNQNVSLSQLVESGEILSFAAKWLGEKEVFFYSVHGNSKTEMLRQLHSLLEEADAVIHYNGRTFDTKWSNAEFVRMGWNPPSPYQQIDLLSVVKKNFRFPSNKLDYVSQQLGIGKKTSHTGFKLWLDCMAGDEKAWKLFEKYNRQDVLLTEKLYKKLLPWISDHPSIGLYTSSDGSATEGCTRCGATLAKRGFAYTSQSRFQRYQCKNGHWSRGTKRIDGTSSRGIGT